MALLNPFLQYEEPILICLSARKLKKLCPIWTKNQNKPPAVIYSSLAVDNVSIQHKSKIPEQVSKEGNIVTHQKTCSRKVRIT
jgi:hypothetical protein